ncbi:MAG: hypothetical protein R2838_16095 [Caldilineaceae bacterium]
MRNAQVDARRDAGLTTFAQVDACGRAPEVQRGDGERFVLGEVDPYISMVALDRALTRR